MTQKKQMAEDEKQTWVHDQFSNVKKYLGKKSLILAGVEESSCRFLVPIVALWKISLVDKKVVWVISGDMPTDHVALNKDVTARDVIRQFSFKWQLQAESILQEANAEQKVFANLLISRAEGIYKLFEKDELWQG